MDSKTCRPFDSPPDYRTPRPKGDGAFWHPPVNPDTTIYGSVGGGEAKLNPSTYGGIFGKQ